MKLPNPARFTVGGLKPGESPYFDVRFYADDPNAADMIRHLFGDNPQAVAEHITVARGTAEASNP